MADTALILCLFMVSVRSIPIVAAVGAFLRSAHYDVEHLGHDMDLSDGLHANRDNLEVLLAKTAGTTPLALLARLFFVCWPVEEAICRRSLPDDFVDHCLACGLLEREHDKLAASACLLPFRDQIQACDSTRTRLAIVNMVTGPSAATHFPARLAIGGENETTLDLGAGAGALALEAAGYSREVVGTDINPRALRYAEFNAVLNGVQNVEWLEGNAFEPIGSRCFSRIIANPPFFLSPAKTFSYCDNPFELDGFTALLARQAPQHLEEGGYFQMICEWVDLEHEPWEQRLRQWTDASHCDVLVLLAPRLTPVKYAEKRAAELRLMQTTGIENNFTERLGYLTSLGVKHVIGGIITMRKRTAASNWFVLFGTELVGNHLGPAMRARFAALTLIATSTPEELLKSKFRLAGDVVLEQRQRAGRRGWQTQDAELVKREGLIDRLRLDETVSSFLPLFDGELTVDEIAAIVAERLPVDLDEARQRCLALARRLLQSNFVELL